MDSEEEEASKLSNPHFQVEDDDDDDSTNVTVKTAVVGSGEEHGQEADPQCEPESAAELSESEPPPREEVMLSGGGEGEGEGEGEGGDVSIGGERGAGDELAESRVDDGGAELRDSQPSASLVVCAEDGGLVAGEGGVGDVMMEGGDSSVPALVVVGGGNDDKKIDEESRDVETEVEREVADDVVETEKKDEAAEELGEKDDVAEEMEEKADAVEEMEEKTEAAEEMEEKADAFEEIEEKAEVVEEIEQKAEAFEEFEEKAGAVEEMEEKADAVEEMEEKADAFEEIEGRADAVEEIEGRADAVEEIEELADAVEEIEEKADAVEETEVRADNGEETGVMTEVGEERKEIAEEIKPIVSKEDTEIAEEVDAADMAKDTVVGDETELDDVEERMELREEETGVTGEAWEMELGGKLLEKETEEDEVAEMRKETEEAEMRKETEEAEMREETDVDTEMGDAAEETEEAEADMADEMERANVEEETEEAEADMADETDKADVAEEMEIGEEVEEVSRTAGGKRKRGGKNSKSPGRAPSRKKSEEDVCFICFDGGELVLCDRRGCPKAYHPACVNRDEAFFRAKGRWNCGWHLCSICEKNAFYMCYTCTFSLCKGCTKDAVFLCVRGNKGFCETCMKTVMLIEKNEQGNKEMGQVDFDDKGSWEFLFKDYWLDLKGRLSLSLDELAHAKNPWKGSDIHASKQNSPDGDYDASKDGGQDSGSSGNAEATVSKRRKAKKRSKSRAKEDGLQIVAVTGAEGPSTDENIEWASPELIELVMHMRNGDKSVLSQFDVQTLLLDYIKKYKLRDPQRRTHVICDARLQNLFGKPRVGHFEMLKLLESHFLTKEESHVDDLQESIVDTEANQLEADGSFDALIKGGKDKKRRTRKKGDGRGLQSNLDDYAAIDMHNINLIYLRRNLAEELLEDTETFHDKVVGCFARIRISGSVQKQDLYRLVQVVGTSKVAEPYKVGKRTTDILLEILNLNKTEVISIDIISNQEFTEDECKRLRQSIKCGLINRLSVGDIQEKAIALQAVRVNDWMESEILRLSHLRDRASDMGHRKELRECVEKLQLLKTPEERQRRLEEIPEIHSDPKMDPSYESEEDDGEAERQENYKKPRGSAFSRRGREQISPRTASNEFLSGTRNYSSGNKELSRSMSNKGMNKGDDFVGAGEIVNENLWNQGRDKEMQQLNSWEKPRSALNFETGARNSHSVVLSESITRAASEISPTTPAATGATQSGAKINESEKIWHYKDPSGKDQGPFSMVQLRKWSNTGYFPANLKIWRATDKQDDSILLTDALAGKFHKDTPLVDAGLLKSHTVSYSGKPHGAPFQQGMEGQVGGVSNFDQNRTTLNSHSILGSSAQSVRESWKETGSTGGAPPSSIEVHKHFRDGWGSETNLPSPTPTPTPTQRTVEAMGKTFEREWSPTPVQPSGSHMGKTFEREWSPTPVQPSGSHMMANMFSGEHGGQQPSTVVVPESGQLINSFTPSSSTAKFSGGADSLNMSHGVSSASKPETVESHRMQVNVHQLPATAAVASMNPGVDLKNIAASIQSLVQHSSTHTPVETHGWGSGVVARPEMISPSPKPGSVSQTWGSAPSQKLESNNSVSMPAQSPAFAQAHVSSFSTGNSSGVFPAPGPSGIPPSDSWRPQVPGHSNVQLPAQSNLPWGTGVTANQNVVPRQGQENQNTGWRPMPGNSSMGWVGQGPANTNMNWRAPAQGQGQAPGHANPGWAAQGQGQAPGHANPSWAAPGQTQAPGNAIPGWVPPGQGPAPLNANPGWVAPGQGPPPPGNANPGWAAPTGNPGMWGSEQNNGVDRFSSQRDRASQGGDPGYGGGRPWNRQSSFGNRGDPSRPPPFNKGQRVCKFHESGHCKKGSQCDYMHT